MATVRFASTCDAPGCGRRSEEYTEWPRCRECFAHRCPEHQVAGTLTETDLDAPASCLCVPCAEDALDILDLERTR